MSAADQLEALRTILLADPTVSGIAGTRVRCLALHPDDEKALTAQTACAAIRLKPAGGPGARGYQQFGKRRVDITCYGSSIDESYDLYLAVQPLLHQIARVKIAGVLLHSAREESAAVSGINPLTQWPETYSSWLVLASDIAA